MQVDSRLLCSPAHSFRMKEFSNVVSAADCETIIVECSTEWARSGVFSVEEGKFVASTSRTSDIVAITKKQLLADRPVLCPILANICERTGTEFAQLAGVNILRYSVGQQFDLHYDGTYCTLLVYLNTVEEEAFGKTSFPMAGYSIQPTQGKAMLWNNVCKSASGFEPDSFALHQGFPLLQGQKYAMDLFFDSIQTF